ncbi:hypothetical protein MMC11_001525 [Xylographa trunciseda]|nr:hypothetical protein [Xylographa trunciseda]
MPRPKRSKVPPSTPIPMYSLVTSDRILKDALSPHLSACNTTNSDDSEGLITTVKRNARSKNGASEEISMSGALALDDVKGSSRLPPPHRIQRAALSRLAREADHARAIEGLKKRRDEAITKGRAPKFVVQEMNLRGAHDDGLVPSSVPNAEEVAQVEVETGDFQIQRTTVERFKPIPFSTCKLQATPSTESSILVLANFRHRPRQPSILQIGRQDYAASESELDDMLDDFHPEDESTPFHVTRSDATTHATRATPTHPANAQRSVTSSSPDRRMPISRKRKLTSPSVQVPNSQSSPDRLSSSSHEPTYDQALDLHISPKTTLYESDPDLPSNKPTAPPAETIWSDTMAPPESSSPPQLLAKSITTKITAFKRKQAEQKIDDRRVSTLVSSKSSAWPLKSISTAKLQTLLPRRSHRPAKHASGEFDILDSSDLELNMPEITEDEDELSFAAPTVKRRGVTQSRKSTKRMKRATTMKKKPGETAHEPPNKGGSVGINVVKTYSRRLSDKENVNGDGDGLRSDGSNESRFHTSPDQQGDTGKKGGALPAKAKMELKTLAKKFKEVDRWEMEFEQVTASSSSPWDAR